jgi:hypothetical protein
MPSTMIVAAPRGKALRQRHQRERAALALVVGAQQDENVFECDDDDQRPQDHRKNAEHVGRAAAGCIDGLAQRVERARADVAIDNTDAADRQGEEAGRRFRMGVSGRRRRRASLYRNRG